MTPIMTAVSACNSTSIALGWPEKQDVCLLVVNFISSDCSSAHDVHLKMNCSKHYAMFSILKCEAMTQVV